MTAQPPEAASVPSSDAPLGPSFDAALALSPDASPGLPPRSTLAPASAADLHAWLDEHAERLDTDRTLAPQIVPRLAAAGLFGIGVPQALAGTGGTAREAIMALAGIAEHSLAAAFVFWGQRTFIEYVLRSPNPALAPRYLPALLRGELAGATGLSNAMKYLSKIEPLQMHATPLQGAGAPRRWTLAGGLPWITNLRPEGFVAAAAFDHPDDAPASIFAIPHTASGVVRSDDLDLVALRASNTAALRLDGTLLDADDLITDDAPAWLPTVRPRFLGLQCGMSVGLARRCLRAAAEAGPGAQSALGDDVARQEQTLHTLTERLLRGVMDDTFVQAPAAMFDIRIALADVLVEAIALEIQAAGGRGYLRGRNGTARRAREAAFIPIVTPSLVQLKQQLKQQLARHRETGA
ncbi:MAG: acyl-CoA dehydrogenase family protein [Janthinobacterium lividum]